MFRVTIGNEAKPGSGLASAVNVLFQAGSLVASEAVSSLVPNFRQLSLQNKIAINVTAGAVPVVLGIVAATVIDHKLQNSNVRQQGQQGQRR